MATHPGRAAARAATNTLPGDCLVCVQGAGRRNLSHGFWILNWRTYHEHVDSRWLGGGRQEGEEEHLKYDDNGDVDMTRCAGANLVSPSHPRLGLLGKHERHPLLSS